MGWRVIGRGVLLSLSALGGCASTPRDELPLEADVRFTLLAVYEAVGQGDEAKYRQLVQLAPGDAYSDALTTTMFESIRLHQAVEQRGFKEREDAVRLRSPQATDAGAAAAVGESLASSRPLSRPSSLAAVDYRENARAMIKAAEGWTFTVRGDRATIDQLADQPNAPTFRRVKERWVLVPTPWDAPRDSATYRLMVESERRLAAALASARDAVTSGSAKSIEDVNAILRESLAEPTTQP